MALLPDTSSSDIGTGIAVDTIQPNKTYKMMIGDEQVSGSIERRLDAVQQAAYKILNTERYKHVIYSWDYGVELQDLFGKPIPYVLSEIPRRIKEALLQDDRIEDVTDFNISYEKDNSNSHGRRGDVLVNFKIRSIYGEIAMNREVAI